MGSPRAQGRGRQPVENIAYVAVEHGHPDQAVRLLGAAEAIREAGRSQMAFDEEPEYAAFLERARAEIAPTAFEDAWTAGRALSQSDAVAIALAWTPPRGSG